jgi:hypothetical protein
MPDRARGSARVSSYRLFECRITGDRSRLCVQVPSPIASSELDHGEAASEQKLAALPALRQDQKAFDDPRHGDGHTRQAPGESRRIDSHETTRSSRALLLDKLRRDAVRGWSGLTDERWVEEAGVQERCARADTTAATASSTFRPNA